MNEISKDMINELHQLTGAGIMQCKESLSALVEALKANINRKRRKTDVGYKIKIDFEEYSLREIPQERTVALIKFIGICSDDEEPKQKQDCTKFSYEVNMEELPKSLIKAYSAYEKEKSKIFFERNDEVLTELEGQMFKEFDDFLKKKFNKKFVHTDYFTTSF